jgi:hypothetical protein
MSRYRITAIKRDQNQPYCLIDAVEFAGRVHKVEEAMRWLDASPDNALWVLDDAGEAVWVSARQHARTGRYFFTTERDGKPLNQLLGLPECREREERSVFRFARGPLRQSVSMAAE